MRVIGETTERKRDRKERPKPTGPTFSFASRLPDGMTPEQAREKVRQAMRNLARGGRR